MANRAKGVQTLRLGPDDHGRGLSRAEYEQAEYAGGHRYELIAGSLHVSPFPNVHHEWAGKHIEHALTVYSREHPEVINWVSPCRIISNALGGETDPEPDIGAYRDFPTDPPPATWQDLFPILVVEVISPGSQDKDLIRNRQLYSEIEQIREYWIVDPRQDCRRPSMIALRRAEGAAEWTERSVPAGGVYQTDLLPGLVLDLSL